MIFFLKMALFGYSMYNSVGFEGKLQQKDSYYMAGINVK